MVEGEKKGNSHGEQDGEFDSSHIVLKRWDEYERERRRAIFEEHQYGSSWVNDSGTLIVSPPSEDGSSEGSSQRLGARPSGLRLSEFPEST
jgi:hypothetical protein